jgi:3'-5' exoribonuclease-like protein
MRYFLDSEFSDTGRTIDLISIGIVSEDGRELYLQSCEFYTATVSPWVEEHVLPQLSLCPHIHNSNPSATADLFSHRTHGQCTFSEPAQCITGLRGVKITGGHLIGAHAACFWRTHEQIRNEVRAFLTDPTELWGWYAAYDFVALCQLFGTMMDLPTDWPHHIKEFQQIVDDRSISDDDLPKQEDGLHNALADAKHLKKLWGYLVRNDCWQ